MKHFTEDQINRLKHFAEKYGLGHVELEESDNSLELPVCGMSIAFETEVFSNKSLLGSTLSDGYVVHETCHSYSQAWGEDAVISEVGVYVTFNQAVIALLTRAYECKVYYEVMEHDIHKAYEDNLEDIPMNKQTVFRDNNEETHIEFDSNNGSVLVEDELYRQAVNLNLEDMEMIINAIRKAHPDFMKG